MSALLLLSALTLTERRLAWEQHELFNPTQISVRKRVKEPGEGARVALGGRQ